MPVSVRPTSVVRFEQELIDYYDLPVQPDQVLTLVDAKEVMEMFFADDFICDPTLAEAEEHIKARDEAQILLRLTLCSNGLKWN